MRGDHQYGNEAAVGEALAEYDREEVFLTSKVLPEHLGYESLIGACEASLDRLGTDHLDRYPIHWPNPTVSLRETLDAMALLSDRGLVRNVGEFERVDGLDVGTY
jgi:diketogulonate reductase-like aldo/keto reductase